MEILKILETFHKSNTEFPQEAVEAAIERKDEMIPEFIGVLRYTINYVEEVIEKELWGQIYALYLLAQFRAKEAYPVVVEFLELPGEQLGELLGDFAGMGSILASISCGDTSLIKRLIENEDADEFIRCSAQEALLTLCAIGEIEREELISYYRELFEGKLERTPAPVWDILVEGCAQIYADELKEHIMEAFDAGLIWEGVIPRTDVEEAFAEDKETILDYFKNDYGYTLIDDVINEMSVWNCFNEDAVEDAFEDDDER